MAKTTKKRLRATWLQVHKWIGLTLAILIIPISLTGSALVWKGWVDQQLQPQRYASMGPAALPPSAYAGAVAASLQPGERLSELRFQTDGKPLIAVVTKPSEGRPTRTQVWIDPRDASIVDRAPANSGIIQVMHVLHGSLMVPGLGPDDRRLGGHLHVRVVPDRHLAVVAARRRLPFRIAVETPQHDQRQPPLSNGLLGPVPARHAVVHRGLDQFPQRLRQV